MSDYKEQLETQLREIRKINLALVEILNSKRISTKDIDKRIVLQNNNVVVELTKMTNEGENEVHNTPFNSDLVLVDGAVDVTHNGSTERLDSKNRLKTLPKGSTAFGKSIGDSAVLTIIDIK